MCAKPFSQAAQQNQASITEVLRDEFKNLEHILEIGSGSGQHAVYFCAQMPHLIWQPSDLNKNLAGISTWIEEATLANILNPIELDVCKNWPDTSYDGAYAANVAHIMHWHEIEAMFAGVGEKLKPSGVFCLYGPFNEHGEYTSESNRAFDQWLQDRDPNSCIRDKEDLNKLAIKHSLESLNEWVMPANNKILSWVKK